jgi:predicted amidophosphoribosyltransferase
MNTGHANHWRLRQPRYRLVGRLCQACGQPVFPARSLCPDCAKLFSTQPARVHFDAGLVVWLPQAVNNYVDQESQATL